MLDKETDSIMYDALKAMENGYRTGDFSEFIGYLAEDCEIKTHLKSKPIVGINAVTAYYESEGKRITDKNIPASYMLPVSYYMHPEKCIYLMPVKQEDKTCIKKHEFMATEEGTYEQVQIRHEQRKRGLLIDGPGIPFTYVDLILNSEEKVKRILLLDPNFFHYGKTVIVDIGNGDINADDLPF